MYAVRGHITHRTGSSEVTHHTPTFYLDGQVQGIVSTEGAKQIARDILDPTEQWNGDLHVDATYIGNGSGEGQPKDVANFKL